MSLVTLTIKYKMGVKSLIVAVVFLLPILWRPAEARLMSFAAKTLTRLTMKLDARLDPNKDDDVVRRTSIYLVIMEKKLLHRTMPLATKIIYFSATHGQQRGIPSGNPPSDH